MLNRLDGLSRLLPDPRRLPCAHGSREAVLALQIEGTAAIASFRGGSCSSAAGGLSGECGVPCTRGVDGTLDPVAPAAGQAQRTICFLAVTSGTRVLEEIGLIRELTGRKRDRLFGCERSLTSLSEGT